MPSRSGYPIGSTRAAISALAAQVRPGSQEDVQLERAVNFFASVGATRYLTRAEAQLAAVA